jgi:hypothetical protein
MRLLLLFLCHICSPLEHLDLSTLLTQHELIVWHSTHFTQYMFSKYNKISPHSLGSKIPWQLLAFPLHLQHDVERNLGTPRQMLPAPVLCGKYVKIKIKWTLFLTLHISWNPVKGKGKTNALARPAWRETTHENKAPNFSVSTWDRCEWSASQLKLHI